MVWPKNKNENNTNAPKDAEHNSVESKFLQHLRVQDWSIPVRSVTPSAWTQPFLETMGQPVLYELIDAWFAYLGTKRPKPFSEPPVLLSSSDRLLICMKMMSLEHFYFFNYLAGPGLSCSTGDFILLLWHA